MLSIIPLCRPVARLTKAGVHIIIEYVGQWDR